MKILAEKLQAVTEEINAAIADHHAKWGLDNPPRLLVGVVEVAYDVLMDELVKEMVENQVPAFIRHSPSNLQPLNPAPAVTGIPADEVNAALSAGLERIFHAAMEEPVPENGKAVAGAARTKVSDDDLRAAVAAEMERLTRLLGRAPTVPEWNQERDPSLPTAKGLFARLKSKWADLVGTVPSAAQPPKKDEKLTSESEWQEAVEELVGVEALERLEYGTDTEPVTPEVKPSTNGNSAQVSPAITAAPEPATVTPLRIEPAPSITKTVPLQTIRKPRTLAEVDADAGVAVPDAPAAVTTPKPVSKPADPSYVEQMAAKRKELRKRFLAVVAEIAVDGTMPTIAEFNERKPADMPRAGEQMNQLGYTSWDEVADDAGLKFAGRRVPMKVKGGRR
ncbi:MAG: hypothetical protein IT328_04425 [Caldilineaceae bacterium]|nr:hypothetical protein [Caldilineaceae bacterium]